MEKLLGLVASALALAATGAAQNDAPATKTTTGLESAYYVAGSPRVRHSLGEEMRRYRVPAVSIAVIDDYRVAWRYAAGLRDVTANSPATPATIFQAASMSKPVAASAILRLFQEKGLSLDSDVNTMLRSWRVPSPPANSEQRVTMRRLLSHSAGINVHGFAGYDRDAALPTLLQVLDGAPPANSDPIRVTSIPGSKTEYSGGGTSIAQQVAVDVSGEPFPAFMQQMLLEPLRMSSSTFDQPIPKALWPRAASGYSANGKPVHRGWHVYPTMAAAGLWTTASDLATFVIAIQNGLRGRGQPPIDDAVAREMTTKASQGFGLGPEVQPGYFSHNGANEGFQGIFLGLDDGGKGVVVMTNSENGLLIADEIVHSVAKAYHWPVLQPQPKAVVPIGVDALRRLAGNYAASFDGEGVVLELTLSSNRKELVLRSPLNAFPAFLYPESRMSFFTLTGETFVFSADANGRVTQVKLGDSAFKRVP